MQYIRNYKVTNGQMYDILHLKNVVKDYEQAICMYLERNEWLFDQIINGPAQPPDILVSTFPTIFVLNKLQK